MKSSADTLRAWALAGTAVVIGLSIAYVDTRPTWEDTGITAGALLVGSLAIAFVAGRRPWLWGILVGIWVPAFAIGMNGDPASVLGLAFAVAGSYAGYAASRSWREHRGPAREG
jgi:hypothetical protein